MNPLAVSIAFAITLILFCSFYESFKSTGRATAALNSVDVISTIPIPNGKLMVKNETSTASDDTPTKEERRSVFMTPIEEWRQESELNTSQSNRRLKVFVYDSIPNEFTHDIVSCMKDLAKVDDPDSFSSLTTKMADIALVHLFHTYPDRTDNPNEADIFFVPYPHAGHCYCAEGWKIGCGHVPDETLDRLFASLTHYNETSAARHLFVLSGHQFFTHTRLLGQPLKLLGGNLSPEELDRKERGTIVIPYLNEKMMFQRVFHRSAEWWVRPRKYAFSFVFGASNSRNSGTDPRRVRLIFRDNWIRRNREELGGLPVHIHSFNTSAIPKDAVWEGLARYHQSVFCPILAGDSAQQARFFDAMMAGCIPVVLEFRKTKMTKNFPNSWATDLPSWYRRNGEATGAVYPFHNSLVDEFGIDYSKCVLTVSARGNDDVMKIPGVIDRMLLSKMSQVREMQRNLESCARRTAFAMASNAHKYEDAFALILRMVQHHLAGLKSL